LGFEVWSLGRGVERDAKVEAVRVVSGLGVQS